MTNTSNKTSSNALSKASDHTSSQMESQTKSQINSQTKGQTKSNDSSRTPHFSMSCLPRLSGKYNLSRQSNQPCLTPLSRQSTRPLTVHHIRSLKDTFLYRLQQAHTSKNTLNFYKRIFKETYLMDASHQYASYYDFYLHIRPYFQREDHQHLLSAVLNLGRFDRYGLLPSRALLKTKALRTKEERLTEASRQQLKAFKQDLEERHYAPSTIDGYLTTIARFLCYLQDNGIDSTTLSDLTPETVDAFYAQLPTKDKHVTAAIHQFLQSQTTETNRSAIEKIIATLPNIVRVHKPFPILDDDEVQRMKQIILYYEGDKVTRRDKALVALAMATGLRSGDLARLTFDDIDLQHERLIITQHKTQRMVTIPLLPMTLNILFDYVKYERPRSDDHHVFLSATTPYHPLTPGTIYTTTKRVYDAAGIRQNGGRHGLHLLRHNLAIDLLNHQARLPLVQTILGHACPLTTEK